MNDTVPAVTVALRADTAPFSKALKELEDLSDSFGASLTGALRDAAVSGKSLDQVLRNLGQSLAGQALNRGLEPLSGLASSLFAKAIGGIAGLFPFADGGVFSGGGIVSQPTTFPMRGGVGLMGEAGPEAIMPLARGPDGRLGVAAGQGAQPVSIVFNVHAPDPATFAKSESQLAEMLARTVSRGFRNY